MNAFHSLMQTYKFKRYLHSKVDTYITNKNSNFIKTYFRRWNKISKSILYRKWYDDHQFLIFKGSAYLYLWRYYLLNKSHIFKKLKSATVYHSRRLLWNGFSKFRHFCFINHKHGVKYHVPRYSMKPDIFYYQNQWKRQQLGHTDTNTWCYISPRNNTTSTAALRSHLHNKPNKLNNNSSRHKQNDYDMLNLNDTNSTHQWLKLNSGAAAASESCLRALAKRRSYFAQLKLQQQQGQVNNSSNSNSNSSNNKKGKNSSHDSIKDILNGRHNFNNTSSSVSSNKSNNNKSPTT